MTRPIIGSMPVVEQSIMNPIVPVGARTVSCAFRKPFTGPDCRASCHRHFATAASERDSSVVAPWTSASLAARCLETTSNIETEFIA